MILSLRCSQVRQGKVKNKKGGTRRRKRERERESADRELYHGPPIRESINPDVILQSTGVSNQRERERLKETYDMLLRLPTILDLNPSAGVRSFRRVG